MAVILICPVGILDPGGGCGQWGHITSRVLPAQEQVLHWRARGQLLCACIWAPPPTVLHQGEPPKHITFTLTVQSLTRPTHTHTLRYSSLIFLGCVWSLDWLWNSTSCLLSSPPPAGEVPAPYRAAWPSTPASVGSEELHVWGPLLRQVPLLQPHTNTRWVGWALGLYRHLHVVSVAYQLRALYVHRYQFLAYTFVPVSAFFLLARGIAWGVGIEYFLWQLNVVQLHILPPQCSTHSTTLMMMCLLEHPLEAAKPFVLSLHSWGCSQLTLTQSRCMSHLCKILLSRWTLRL